MSKSTDAVDDLARVMHSGVKLYVERIKELEVSLEKAVKLLDKTMATVDRQSATIEKQFTTIEQLMTRLPMGH